MLHANSSLEEMFREVCLSFSLCDVAQVFCSGFAIFATDMHFFQFFPHQLLAMAAYPFTPRCYPLPPAQFP